jgi:nicotinamidase-related amidase
MPLVTIEAEPTPVAVDLAKTALVIIDMQRDFLEPGGFGEALGNNVSRLAAAVEPCRAVLDAARRRGLLVIHTREGHRADLSDAPPAKVERGAPSLRIGSSARGVGPQPGCLISANQTKSASLAAAGRSAVAKRVQSSQLSSRLVALR